jgi:putative tryptophan/tyrosine transport system substrate-binding protein
MRRREFITLVPGAAAWPLAAHAQQPAMSVVGLLTARHLNEREMDAVRRGFDEVGYSEGRNLAIMSRSAEDQYDRLPALAADLVRREVAVIVSIGGPLGGFAAKNATATIPIVFTTGGDPVKLGLVSSLNRPGGNLTGVCFLVNMLGAKRLQLLHELVPTAAVIGVLANPANPNFAPEIADLQEAARTLGLQIRVANASSERDIDAAFANFRQQRIGALIVAADSLFVGRREQIVALATRDALPALYYLREFVTAGGLISYGTSLTDAYRLAGVYAGRILKGEKPADLPVMQSTRFELVINMKTAKILGVDVPLGLSADCPLTLAKAWCQSVRSLVMHRPRSLLMESYHTGYKFCGGPRNEAHVPEFLPPLGPPRFTQVAASQVGSTSG